MRPANALVSPWIRRSRTRSSSSRYSTVVRSRSATGREKPARCKSWPSCLTSANGNTRGLAPPLVPISPSKREARSSCNVSAPNSAARNRPSGESLLLSCASTPGRSLTECRSSMLIAKSNPHSLVKSRSSLSRAAISRNSMESRRPKRQLPKPSSKRAFANFRLTVESLSISPSDASRAKKASPLIRRALSLCAAIALRSKSLGG